MEHKAQLGWYERLLLIAGGGVLVGLSVKYGNSGGAVALAGGGTILLLVALNGLRIARARIGDNEVSAYQVRAKRELGQFPLAEVDKRGENAEAATADGEAAADIEGAAIESPRAGEGIFEEIGGRDLFVVPPEAVPGQVMLDLLNKLSEEQRLPRRAEVLVAARAEGRGNKPWYVILASDPGRLFRLSYGGRGKHGPTIVEYENQ